MTIWRDDPDGAAAALIEASLDEVALSSGAELLLVNQTDGRTSNLFARAGHRVTIWNRRASAFTDATIGPAQASAQVGFDAALIRMPKSKDELVMTVHRSAAVVRPGGRVIVYGGNDEGLRTVAKRLSILSTAVQTVATRQHGRIIAFLRPDESTLRPALEAWRSNIDGWVSYPGLFADGAADPGTRLLINTLPPLTANARILDYGCGPGAIAAAIRQRSPSAQIDVLDNDSLALHAVQQNVPDVEPIVAFDLAPLKARRYNLIVSNPPIHKGIREDHSVLHHLITDGAPLLTVDGAMLLVVQKRVMLQAELALKFGKVETAADDGRFLVWRCTKPKVRG